MASGDPRDPMYGLPYTGVPVQQAPRGGSQSVLDMISLADVRVVTSATDNHHAPNGRPYHE